MFPYFCFCLRAAWAYPSLSTKEDLNLYIDMSRFPKYRGPSPSCLIPSSDHQANKLTQVMLPPNPPTQPFRLDIPSSGSSSSNLRYSQLELNSCIFIDRVQGSSSAGALRSNPTDSSSPGLGHLPRLVLSGCCGQGALWTGFAPILTKVVPTYSPRCPHP